MGLIVSLLGATQVIGYGTIYYAFAILAPSVAAEFGVPQSALFGVFSLGILASGLVAPKLGSLMDRFGAPRIMAIGSALVAPCFAGLAVANDLFTFAALIVALEIVSVAVLYDAAFAALAQAGSTNARHAITNLTLIAGFASTLFWPFTGWLDSAIGWHLTLGAFGLLHLFVALPLHIWAARLSRRAIVGQSRPSARPERTDGRLSGIEAKIAFWILAISFAATGMLISALGVHLVPILQSLGLGASAYAISMLMGPSQVAIRFVDAVLWRGLHPLTVALISAVAIPAAVLALVLPIEGYLAGGIFAVLFGIGGGLSSIVRGTVPLVLFGSEGYATRLGVLTAVRNVLGASAPFAFSVALENVGLAATLVTTASVGIAAVVTLAVLTMRMAANRL